MGNHVGKIIGTVVGAACQLIPGVGTVVGTLILAGTTLVGSGVDALVDSNNQNAEADRAAEEARRQAAIELERRRLEQTRNLEEQARIARENEVAAELQIENTRRQQLQAANAQAEAIREAQAQLDLVQQSLVDCDTGNFSAVPGRLQGMDDNHFNLFSQQALSRCQTPDAMEDCRLVLEHEQLRRETVQGWSDQVNNVVSGNQQSTRVRMNV